MFEMVSAAPTELAISAAACAAHVGQRVTLHGHIHRVRRMQGFAFVVLRTKDALLQCVYDPESAGFSLDTLMSEAPVRVTGDVVAEPRSRTGWELRITGCEPLAVPEGEPPAVLGGKTLELSLDTLLDLRPATLRHPEQRAIFRVQAALTRAFASFFEENGFTGIHTPKLVAFGAEGGANVFSLDYFGRQAHLAQSPQLYKQMMVGVLERVYEIGPVFRAEKHDTARHLNEYTSVDMEMGFIGGFEDIMRMETAMLRHVLSEITASCAEALALLGADVPQIGDALPSIRFGAAKALIAERYHRKPSSDMDLEPDEEKLLSAIAAEETGSPFLFVTHYPSEKRPFYAMDTPSEPSVTESFDLLFSGLEVTTGGQRIHSHRAQVEKMRRLGLDEGQFSGYLMAHKTGLPPHGGFGLGLERFTARLLNQPNIRQATLFPRDRGRLEP